MSIPPSPRCPAARPFPLRAALLLLALPLVVGGCLPWRSAPTEWDGAQRPQGVQLEVVSQHFNDVVVYIVPDGQRRRIGAVGGHSTEMFDISSHSEIFSRSFRLVGEPIGSRETYVSDPITANHGDVVVLVLTSELRMSHWHIRRAGE
jgi:hypothetical protein